MASSMAAGLRPGKSFADVTELGDESSVGVLKADRDSGVAKEDIFLARRYCFAWVDCLA